VLWGDNSRSLSAAGIDMVIGITFEHGIVFPGGVGAYSGAT
jgi:hypothetical protein